jgi:hypothetical protein
MPVRDHLGLVLDKFNGLWNRGDVDATPIDHFSDCLNIKFKGGSSFATRDGIGISQNVSVPLYNIKRIYNYATQTANTLLVLTYDGTTGNIYHVVSPTLIYGPILTIVGMQDFAFVPYAGRAFISPFATTQLSLNPPLALTALVAPGTGLGVGVYSYATTLLTSIGETTPSLLTTVTTLGAIPNPGVNIPVITDAGNVGTNNLVVGQIYKWKFTFCYDPSHPFYQTLPSNASLGFTNITQTDQLQISVTTSINPALYTNIYRTVGNGAIYYLEAEGISAANLGGYVVGLTSDAALITQATAPVANTTQTQQVNLSSIPVSSPTPGGVVIGRNIYRTAVNASQLKLLTTIADDTTTVFTDITADVSLGVNAPTVNTAFIGTEIIQLGLTGQFLYIYAGDGTAARLAAGAGMTGTMTIGNGVTGYTDPGLHIFGFVAETISGYLTPPTILTKFTTVATNSVDFGAIPTSGSPYVVKRHLVATKVIDPTIFNGDLTGYEFFFVPNAEINNNTDTFLNNISFYDAQLLEDASYLLNNYTQVPAGASLSLYHNRLCLAATATDPSLMLVSAPGELEAFDQVAGLIVVPLDGNPITNAQEMRDVLYVFKRAKTYGYADNGGDPSSWPSIVIDNALGTCVHGIATVLDSGSSSVDFLIVCTFQGVSQFNGKYVTPELSWKIEAVWKALNRNSFGLIQLVNAPIQKEIYIVLPTGNILVANYANGMDSKNIRWTQWNYTMFVNTVAIQNISDIILGVDLI